MGGSMELSDRNSCDAYLGGNNVGQSKKGKCLSWISGFRYFGEDDHVLFDRRSCGGSSWVHVGKR